MFCIGVNRANPHIIDQTDEVQIIHVASQKIEVVEVLLDFFLHLIRCVICEGDHHNAVGHILNIAALGTTKKADSGNHGVRLSCSSTSTC